MTVQELREALSRLPSDMPVRVVARPLKSRLLIDDDVPGLAYTAGLAVAPDIVALYPLDPSKDCFIFTGLT